MDLKWNPGRASRPISAAVRVTDWSWRGNLNPRPLPKDDGELLVDEYLSPRKLVDQMEAAAFINLLPLDLRRGRKEVIFLLHCVLIPIQLTVFSKLRNTCSEVVFGFVAQEKVLTGVDDLQQVKALEMQVDTRENSLGNFGAYLPNLRELKLNNSLLMSVRDLGTTLSHLHVLWMARCGLSDLDGISSCSSLKELYIAYNNISDLSQLTWLDHLEVLDLEGNDIEDINQMRYLGLCCKLSRLTVEGNLVCLKPNAESLEEPGYNYRAEVKKLIPQLEYLDEIPASQTALLPSKKMHEDCLNIKKSIKEGGLAGDISWLGLSQVICGNPTRALHARRQKLGVFTATPGSSNSNDGARGCLKLKSQRMPPVVSPSKPCDLRTENLDGSGGGGGLHQEGVISGRRGQHKRCLRADQQEETSRALKVTLSDEDKGEDCGVGDGCEDELRQTAAEKLIERISLDSSCHSSLPQSSSGSSEVREAAAFSNPNRRLIPSPPKSSSPASVTGVVARPWKTRNHGARCLKIPNLEEERQWRQRCQSRARQEMSAQAPAASGAQGQGQPPPSTARQKPVSGPEPPGSTSVGPVVDESLRGETHRQQPAPCSSLKASPSFGLTDTAWPLTTSAVLPALPGGPAASTTLQEKSSRS